MRELVFKMPGIFDDAFEILNLKRGRERRENHHQIIIETLRVLDPQRPTRDELQKHSHIRRKRFIQVLKYLVEGGAVIRTGDGTKFDPFYYSLSEAYKKRPGSK